MSFCLCSSSVLIYIETILLPVGIYLSKVNSKNSRKWIEIYPKLTKKAPGQHQLTWTEYPHNVSWKIILGPFGQQYADFRHI